MKFQFLPHYFKFIGIALYTLVGLPLGMNAFINGLNAYPIDVNTIGLPAIFFTKTFHVIEFTAILIYALAKDRIFDEFMLRIRLESMYIVFFSTLIFILVRIIIDKDWDMSASLLFEVQVLLFLVINKIRKQAAS